MAVRPHVSYSELMTWKECQWRWFRDYRENRRAPVYSCYMEFGKAIHSALEMVKDPGTPDDVRLTTEQVCETFEKKFRARYLKIRDRDRRRLTDGQIDEFCLAGRRIITHLDDCEELAKARVLFVEHRLMEKIDRTDDVNIKFKGFIDLVIKTKDKRGKSVVYIVDYKTCSWGWNREKRTDEDLLAQLRLYKHFFSKEFNVDPRQVRTAFVLLKRTPKGDDIIEWFPYSSGPKTTMRAVSRLNEAITGMQSNDYHKNRNACVNTFGDVCPYKDTPLCSDD